MADYKSNNTYKTLKNGYPIFTTNHTNITRENYNQLGGPPPDRVGQNESCLSAKDGCCLNSESCFCGTNAGHVVGTCNLDPSESCCKDGLACFCGILPLQ